MLESTPEEVEVRLLDQEKITEFGRINNRLLELRADLKQVKLDIEKMEDAATELMMGEGGKVMLFIGETFVETSEDQARECKNFIII